MTTLNLRALYACNMVASKEETRYYLNGVYTHIMETGIPESPKHRIYVATDGHKLLKIVTTPNSDDNGETMIIPSDVIEKLKGREQGILVTAEDKLHKIHCGDDSYSFTPIDGNYPDYNRAIPSKNVEATVSIGINASELLAIEKAVKYFRDMKPKQTLAMPLEFRGPHEPILINFMGGTTAVLMPMRA